MVKTVSIHAVHTVSIKRVIHLTEPVWRHAKMNLMKINVKKVLLTYRTWITLTYGLPSPAEKPKQRICMQFVGVSLVLFGKDVHPLV